MTRFNDLVDLAYDTHLRDRAKIEELDSYARGDQHEPYGARGHSDEFRALARRSVFNWISLAVNIPCQMSVIEGYRVRDDSDPAEWDAFIGNGMDRRQVAIHRASAVFGHSFAEVRMPDGATYGGNPLPKIKALPTKRMVVLYDDPFNDRFPVFAMRVDAAPGADSPAEATVWYGSERMRVSWRGIKGERSVRIVSREDHGFPVVPIVRWVIDMDLEGRTTGLVAPLIEPQDEVNQAKYDLVVTRNFSSYKVRTASGLEGEPLIDPVTGEQVVDAHTGEPVFVAPEIGPEKFIVSEDEKTKFGTLDETPLDGFIASLNQSVEHFAAVSQIPPHALQGRMANLSAEALVAAEEQLMRLVGSIQRSWGESWVTAFQLLAYAMGDEEAINDYSGQVRWRDMRARSFGETADALGKMAQMLGVPPRSLWKQIPGLDAATLREWHDAADRLPPVETTQQGTAINMSRALAGMSATTARNDGAAVPSRRRAA